MTIARKVVEGLGFDVMKRRTQHNQMNFIATKTVPPHLRATLLNDAAAMGVDSIDVLLRCYAHHRFGERNL